MSRPQWIGLLLAVALAASSFASLCLGSSGTSSPSEAWHALLGWLGFQEPSPRQVFFDLRIFRVIVAIGVGASLALSGALLQAVFRNPLASPDLIGVSSGASLGAALAILAIGGSAAGMVVDSGLGAAALVSLSAFVGAILTILLVAGLAGGGAVSIPALLLIGVAINALLTALLVAIQSLVLADYEVSRALLSWGFGSLDDRSPDHALLVWIGLAPALCVTPFLARELDLLGGGEDDAASLGVSTVRVQRMALAAAALAAAAAVSVAGQIGFVGLLVPHALRLVVGWSHNALLPLSALAGALLLVSADALNRAFFGIALLQPGVVMALLGGPLFLVLLLRARRTMRSW